MSESALSFSYDDLANAACDELGQGTDASAVSDAKMAAVIDARVQEGYRTVLVPPVLPGENTPHRWSWLKTLKTVTTQAPYNTGHVTLLSGELTKAYLNWRISLATIPNFWANNTLTQDSTGATCKLLSQDRNSATVCKMTGTPNGSNDWVDEHGQRATPDGDAPVASGTWPAWATDGDELNIGGVAYRVASRTSDTVLTLSANGPEVSTSIYILSKSFYQMDDDFGAIEGPITYQPHLMWRPIAVVGEGMIRSLKQVQIWMGRPTMAAVTWKVGTGTTGQRAQIQFHPTPDQSYLLTFRCKIIPANFESNKYPLGGMEMGPVYEAAVRACCEKWETQQRGARYAEFLERLTSAVGIDRQNAPEFYGRRSGYGLPGGYDGMYSNGYDGGIPYSPHLVVYNP